MDITSLLSRRLNCLRDSASLVSQAKAIVIIVWARQWNILVYSQSPLDYMRFLASRIENLDILKPTRAETYKSSQLFEFAAGLLDFSTREVLTGDQVLTKCSHKCVFTSNWPCGVRGLNIFQPVVTRKWVKRIQEACCHRAAEIYTPSRHRIGCHSIHVSKPRILDSRPLLYGPMRKTLLYHCLLSIQSLKKHWYNIGTIGYKKDQKDANSHISDKQFRSQ